MGPLDLNLDVRTVDTSRPLFNPGKYPFRATEFKFTRTKADDAYNLNYVFESLEPIPNSKGADFAPGSKLFHGFWMPDDRDRDGASLAVERLTAFIDAVFQISDAADRPIITEEVLQAAIGRSVVISLKVKDDKDYGPQNEVRGFFPHAG